MNADASALDRFREIALDRIRALNQALLSLEESAGDEPDLVDRAMREIHTLKGESRMLGLAGIQRVAHRTEDLLLLAKKEGRLREASALERAYDGLDLMAELLDDEAAALNAAEARIQAFVAAVDEALVAGGGVPSAAPIAVAPVGAPAEAPGPPPEAPAPPPEAPSRRGPDPEATQRVRRTTVDEITRTAGEIGVLEAHWQRLADEATRILDGTRDELGVNAPPAWRTYADAMDAVLRAMRDLGFELSLRQSRLRDGVESMRLAQISTLLDRYPRAVRDLCKELGKEARVVVEGGTVGADQQVLDLLADPLLHLLRNAVDHGLEPPETRESAGKPRRGTIRMRARQAGRFVELMVEDDGRGIDARAIADAAIRRGLLSEADVSRMADEDLFGQLFRPAFSTRETATDVSGRGVGLDVVKRTVDDLGGRISIESDVGRGTTFVLKLPVSIALVDALVLDAGSGLYAVPSAYVSGVVQGTDAELDESGPRPALLVDDGRRAPVVDLSVLLELPVLGAEGEQLAGYVVLEDGTRRLALRVPHFVGEMPLVQEALDPFLGGLRILTGTAMLDGGRRVSMLNPIQLFELVGRPARASHEESSAAEPRPAPRRRPTVLVVEDSDLTRSLVVGTLAEAGYRVLEAANGRDGLSVVASEDVALVVTDLEMPVVDGYGLIAGIREGDRHPDLPIVVFTTRGEEEEKRRAAAAGADVYLLKSDFEKKEVLTTIEQLLAAREESAG